MAVRADAMGLFWNDPPKVKAPPKIKIKRTPPEPTWLSPDYLPHLEEAKALRFDEFTDMELWQAAQRKERLIYDIEVYPNYCLFLFRSIESRKVISLELSTLWLHTTSINTEKLKWIILNFELIHFNGIHFDIPISAIACAGYDSQKLWEATDMIINQQMYPPEVLKLFGVKKFNDVNQIDLIELTALAPSLKVCAGRLHAPLMQELPFKPGSILSEEQALIVRWYCFNDLDNTELLFNSLKEPISIRVETGAKYGIDLRSRSDAQMAEAIINSEVKKLTGQKHIKRNEIAPGTQYQYKVPSFIKFQSPLFNWVLDVIRNAKFTVADNDEGGLIMPPEMQDLVIEINKSKYKFGIGGLHSQEECLAVKTDENFLVIDTDVTSYYPFLILNAGLVPQNMGHAFLQVYRTIVDTRVKAKEMKLTVLAECLKIVVNGTFGKLGNKWSIMYAPDLLLQVTLTGQLCISMLIERFEMAGIEVTSVNTDGIVVKCPRDKENVYTQIVKQWQIETGLSTERTNYRATYSKDINNYFAIYDKPQKGKAFKAKGVFTETSSKKNAVNEICIDAVMKYILDGTAIDHTIKECKDIRRFTSMRKVKGGAVKNGEYLGKIVRWYYAEGVTDEIIYALTGNKVSRSDGGKPLMNLPKEFPEDINYQWYIDESYKILEKIGYTVTA